MPLTRRKDWNQSPADEWWVAVMSALPCFDLFTSLFAQTGSSGGAIFGPSGLLQPSGDMKRGAISWTSVTAPFAFLDPPRENESKSKDDQLPPRDAERNKYWDLPLLVLVSDQHFNLPSVCFWWCSRPQVQTPSGWGMLVILWSTQVVFLSRVADFLLLSVDLHLSCWKEHLYLFKSLKPARQCLFTIGQTDVGRNQLVNKVERLPSEELHIYLNKMYMLDFDVLLLLLR